MIFTFLVGVFAGVLNIVSAGGSLITLPMLIFFGLPGPMANGTNRIAIIIQNLTALYAFYIKGIKNVKLSLLLSIPSIIGSFFGAKFAISLPDSVFNRMLAIIMLLVLIVILFPKKLKKGNNKSEELTLFRTTALIITFLGLGIYGGIIQAAIGFLFIIVINFLLPKLTFSEVQCMKTLVITIYLSLSTFVFILQGLVHWHYAIALALGSGIGGYIGGHLTTVLSEKRLKMAMVIIILILSFKLLISSYS